MPAEDDPWEMRVAEKKSEAKAVVEDDGGDWGVREKYTPDKDKDKNKDKEAKPAENDWGVRDKSVEKGEIVEKNGITSLEQEISKKVKHLIEKSKSHSRKRSPPKKSRSPRK